MTKIVDTSIDFKDCFGIKEAKTPLYPFNGNIYATDGTSSVELIYSSDMWTYMMQYIFPGVFQDDFDMEKSRNNPTMYENMFIHICKDFYFAFIKGQDDISVLKNIPLSLASWANLTDQQKRACFLTYLNSRKTQSRSKADDLYMVRNLSERYANIRIWLAITLLNVLEKIQTHTVNVGRATTRYSQVAQAISSEMASNKYNYISLSGPNDFFNSNKNQNNAKALEDMKTYRITMQKNVDRESTNLIKANSDAEIFTNFINRIVETDLNAFRAIFI